MNENIHEVLKTIQTGSKTHRRITRGIREDLEDVFNIFGNRKECRVCNQEDQDSNHHKYWQYMGYTNLSYYFDDLKKFEKEHNCTLEPSDDEGTSFNQNTRVGKYVTHKDIHPFIQKIELPFEIQASKRFHSNERGDSWFLAIEDEDKELIIRFEAVEYNTIHDDKDVADVDNEILKKLLDNHALEEFFEYVAGWLDKEIKEYEQVRELSDRIRTALEVNA